MTDAPISPLRRRMIEDMTVRKLAARTQEGYIRAVRDFSAFLGASPDTASAEDLRRYRLPVVLSPDEVARLLDAAPGLKYKSKDQQHRHSGLRRIESHRDSRRAPVVAMDHGQSRSTCRSPAPTNTTT
jgi:integrase/recombinase XerD